MDKSHVLILGLLKFIDEYSLQIISLSKIGRAILPYSKLT